MKRSLQRITTTFVLIALIPVGFILYELASLSDNEKLVTRTYNNQLEAILYSVNQFTDDVFSSWANKINISLLKGSISSPELAEENLYREFSQMTALRELYLTNMEGNDLLLTPADSSLGKPAFEQLVKRMGPRITRLKTYQRGGFRKIEALDTLIGENFIPIYFLLDEEITRFRFAVMLVELNTFVQNVLGPKLQAVSRDEFVISAFSKKNNSLIYSTRLATPGPEELFTDPAKESTERELWLLPGYYLAISLKDSTIKDLVTERLENGVAIFAALFVLLIAGIAFLYSNIRREILLSEAKSEFVSNVSHEIRTPLSLISMYAETLEMNRVPEERKHEYYGIIVRETSRLAAIVNRILNFAQLDAGKKKFDFKTIRLNELCAKIVKSYEPNLRERGFAFEFQPFSKESTVSADEESISEAIFNLLDNAVKYSKDDKSIRLRTGNDGVVAFVEVEDRGIGISRIHQKNIFDQFYRVPTNNVHNIKGTGLGLALVKRTMNAHHGKVKVSSTPGQGSTFTLYFPLVEEPAET